MHFKITYLLIILLSIASSGKAQNFFRSYGNSDDEIGKSVIEGKDTTYYVFGTSSSFVNGTANFYLIKIDSTGNFLWSKTYGGNGIDQGHAIALKPNGHFLLTGFSNSFSNGYDILSIEIDSLGNEIWSKNYGGSDWDFAYGNLALPTGEVIITGSTYSFGNGNQDGYLLMLDNNGDSLWMQTYGDANENVLRKSIYTSSGEIVSIGFTVTINGDKDFYLVKTKIDGDTLWTKKYGTTADDEGFSLLEAKNGNYILAGYSEGFGAGDKNGYYFEVDTSGSMIWAQNYGAGGDDIFNAVCAKPNESRFFAAWETDSYGNGGYDFTVNSFYNNGGWYNGGNTYGTAMTEKPYALIFTSHHRILAVGSTNYPYGNSNVMAVLTDTLFPTQSTMTPYIDVTSVDETNESSGIRIFPVPASDMIHISSVFSVTTVNFYDITGNLILDIKDSDINSVMIGQFPSGIYFLEIKNDSGYHSVHRVIISRR